VFSPQAIAADYEYNYRPHKPPYQAARKFLRVFNYQNT